MGKMDGICLDFDNNYSVLIIIKPRIKTPSNATEYYLRGGNNTH